MIKQQCDKVQAGPNTNCTHSITREKEYQQDSTQNRLPMGATVELNVNFTYINSRCRHQSDAVIYTY